MVPTRRRKRKSPDPIRNGFITKRTNGRPPGESPGGTTVTHAQHTVEKIGGTSMSRVNELVDSLFIGGREGADLYERIFVVSAFGGITNLLLEHKKTGEPGVYALFSNAENDHGWMDALNRVTEAMNAAHREILNHPADLSDADDFVRDRIEGARNCLESGLKRCRCRAVEVHRLQLKSAHCLTCTTTTRH